MARALDHEWKDWIQINIDRGCDKDGIVEILLENGFAPQDIVKTMSYQPKSAALLIRMSMGGRLIKRRKTRYICFII